MRVIVIGATGNVGTSLLRALAGEPEVDELLGVARRRPSLELPKVEWAEADIGRDDLASLMAGGDAVVHLAWLIQPSRDQDALWRTNVHGSTRVFRAVREAGVRTLVYASSVGAYSPGPKDRMVDETWPADGIPTSFYGRQKAAVERVLDRFETESPDVRVVRLRPALTFKREAASGIRRLFAGPLLPSPLIHPRFVPFFPDIETLRVQGVHSDDVADAYRRALVSDARGAFNVAAEPVLDSALLASLFDARLVSIPPRLLRAVTSLTWRLRLQPTPPGWVDMALSVPLLDAARARLELGWSPSWSADAALADLLAGVRERAGLDTPVLSPGSGGPLRVRELVTGIGSREAP